MCDPGELGVLLDGQADHLRWCPADLASPCKADRLSGPQNPKSSTALVLRHNAHGDADKPPFQHVALAVGVRLAEQRDRPLIRRQPQRPVPGGQFLHRVVLPAPGSPTIRSSGHAPILRHGEARSHVI